MKFVKIRNIICVLFLGLFFYSFNFIPLSYAGEPPAYPGNYGDYGNYPGNYGNYGDYGNYPGNYGNYGDYPGNYGNYGDYGDYSDYANYSDYSDPGYPGNYTNYSDYSDYSNYSDYFNYSDYSNNCGGDNPPACNPDGTSSTGYRCFECNFCGSCFGGIECSAGNPGVCSSAFPATPTPGPTSPPTSPNAPNMVNATISPRPITANGTTQYTITLTASDPNGGNNIGSLYAHINLQGPNSGTNRGYIGWDVTRAAPAVFPNWTSFKAGSTPAGCTGSGRAAINSGSGDQYINIISCSAPSVVGNTRVINIVVTFNTNFTTPTTNNTISGYVRDFTGLQDTPAWNAFGTFDLAGSNTLTLLSSSNPSLTNQNVTFTGNAPANCAGTWWQWWVDGIQTTTVDTSNTLTPSYTRTWTTAGSHTVQFRGWNRGPCYTPTVRTSNIVTQVINPGVTTYSVSGNIYIDIDGSKTKNGSEVNYVANPSDISIDGAASTFNNGAYTFGNLASGTHTVTYLTKPAGYNMTHPTSSIPPSFSITVGPGCTASPPPAGNCDAGNNITNLNFGINNSSAWIQGYDLDMRFDDGFTDTLPAGKYAMDTDSSGTTPGIVFTGDVSADFGAGQVSTTNQVVGGSLYPEVFSYPSGRLHTSYGYILNNANRSGTTPIDMAGPDSSGASICGAGGIATCNLNPNLPGGIYIANGNLKLNSITFNANKNFVFIINGTLDIAGNIIVSNGTAFFTASGNIFIDRSVGAAPGPKPATGQMQGFYSADRNFILNGYNNCTTPDKMLNLDGAIVMNASGAGGTFTNSRNLCASNSTVPVFTVSPRLDMILNAPAFLLSPDRITTEVAP